MLSAKMTPELAHLSFRLGGKRFDWNLKANVRKTEAGFSAYFTFNEAGFSIDFEGKESVEILALSLRLQLNKIADYSSFFVNGYQTWTESREYLFSESIPRLNPWWGPVNRRYQFKQYGDEWFVDRDPKQVPLYSYQYTYFRQGDQLFFLGSGDESKAFTWFNLHLKEGFLEVKKDVEGWHTSGGRLLDVRFYEGTMEGLGVFWEGFAPKKESAKPVAGWTSWYHYYTDIDEGILLKNLGAFEANKTPISIFQIDDGYQTSIGDWGVNEKFPRGMDFLAKAIQKAGYKAGIWYAPFIVEAKAKVCKTHPEWIGKDETGKWIQVGFSPGWSGPFYVLDIFQKPVQAYIKKTMRKMIETWGFEMLKLDFLYAVCHLGGKERTRAEAMQQGMEMLREWAGETLLLGCGVPLGNAEGLVDYCRIGADVGLKWWDRLLANHIRYRERVSTLAALNNAMGRWFLSGNRFRNDPDVYILRKLKNKLTKDQKYTLYLVNQIFGDLLFTSDYIGDYDEETMRLYQMQFPVFEKKILGVETNGSVRKVRFEVAGRTYQAWFNFSNKRQEVLLESNRFFLGDEIEKKSIFLAPYASKCGYEIQGYKSELLGSDGHIFPGADVKTWRKERGQFIVDRWAGTRSEIQVCFCENDKVFSFSI